MARWPDIYGTMAQTLKFHFWRCFGSFIGLKHRLFFKSEHAGQNIAWERGHLNVVSLGSFIKSIAAYLNAVFGAFKLVLQ